MSDGVNSFKVGYVFVVTNYISFSLKKNDSGNYDKNKDCEGEITSQKVIKR